MARYGTEHKAETRRRIIEAAGRRLKVDGVDGVGIATLMADAGLTNGAFYAHFSSKEDLVRAVVTDQLERQRGWNWTTPLDRPAFENFVRDYLSPGHRDNPRDGCPSAALLEDVSRGAGPVRDAYTDGMLAMIDDVAALLSVGEPGWARAEAMTVFASMVGILQVSRALSDRQLSDEILEQGVTNVLALLEPLMR